ncbi:hypothetical protein KCP74_18340 [Salmonella enterica subsp. enterica]|nr:hypothetical protein KCP74_18340 [Salmonella enterica subsp. enterica]
MVRKYRCSSGYRFADSGTEGQFLVDGRIVLSWKREARSRSQNHLSYCRRQLARLLPPQKNQYNRFFMSHDHIARPFRVRKQLLTGLNRRLSEMAGPDCSCRHWATDA